MAINGLGVHGGYGWVLLKATGQEGGVERWAGCIGGAGSGDGGAGGGDDDAANMGAVCALRRVVRAKRNELDASLGHEFLAHFAHA